MHGVKKTTLLPIESFITLFIPGGGVFPPSNPGGGTPILGHIRDVRPEWVSFPGQKPADGCKFLTKTYGWVIILI